MASDADVIVVGGGLAGLVAATEIADAGKRVIVVDQEGEQSLGGQAFWSLGGLFLVYTLRDASQLQDCVMQGRSNCSPVESTPAGN